MIHRLSSGAALRFPALWPAGRRTPPAPASEAAETPSSPEGLRAGSPTPPALRCLPLWATLSASQHHSILVSGKHPQRATCPHQSLENISASTFTAAQHPTLPPGYAYFYGGVGGMPGLQYGGGVAGGGVYPPTHPGIPVPTAAGQTSTTQFQNKAYGSR